MLRWSLLGLLITGSLLTGAGGLLDPKALLMQDPRSVIVFHEMRLPRTLAAAMAGGALGAAGAVIQGLTRNPLAEPGLLGVNAGAALGLVGAVWMFGPLDGLALITPALAGAVLVSGAILLLGLRVGTGVGLLLGGAALAGISAALLRALILLDPFALDAWRGWIVGSVAMVSGNALQAASLLILPGAALTALTTRQIDALAMGEDAARALGTSVARSRGMALGAVALLSAGAVIVAGPLVFVGLIAPQIARSQGAENAGTLAVHAAIFGAVLVLAADTLGRVVLPGLSVPVGLGVALVGGPIVVWQVARRLDA